MTQRQEIASLKKEAAPKGTRFAAITLLALLVVIGIYLVVVHEREVVKSPLVTMDNSSQG